MSDVAEGKCDEAVKDLNNKAKPPQEQNVSPRVSKTGTMAHLQGPQEEVVPVKMQMKTW